MNIEVILMGLYLKKLDGIRLNWEKLPENGQKNGIKR